MELLSHKIYKALLDNKLEYENNYTINNQKINKKKIKKYLYKIIKYLKIKLFDYKNTINKLSNLYTYEMFYGNFFENFPKIELIKNIYKIEDQIILRNLKFTSICEDHFLIFDGNITISYIPKDYLLSLNDINNIIYFFSHRAQTQEKLCKQIMIALQTILSIKSVAILIEAKHFCIRFRKINYSNIKLKNFFKNGEFITNKKLIHDFFNNKN